MGRAVVLKGCMRVCKTLLLLLIKENSIDICGSKSGICGCRPMCGVAEGGCGTWECLLRFAPLVLGFEVAETVSCDSSASVSCVVFLVHIEFRSHCRLRCCGAR